MGSSINNEWHDLYVIFGINTTSDISKLSQIKYNNFEISLWYLCQISLQIMLLIIQIQKEARENKLKEDQNGLQLWFFENLLA